MTKRAEELKELKWGMFVCWSFSTFSGKEWTPGVTDVRLLQSHRLRHRPVGAHGQGSRHGLHPVSHQAPRRLLPVGHEDHRPQGDQERRWAATCCAELRKVCDKYGIKLALYFSEGDWTWPGAADGNGGNGGGNESRNEEGAAQGAAHAIRPD